MAASIFLSHSAKDPEARRALALLADALATAGYEVLVDKHLKGGDEWRAQIDRWVETCSGAVVLFSKHALVSNPVNSEVERLMGRRQVPKTSFVLIPVLMPDIAAEELRKPLWSHSQIGEMQAMRWADADAVVAALLDVLAPDPDKWDGLDARLVAKFGSHHRESMRRAVAKLGVHRADLERSSEPELRFVRRLLDSQHAEQVEAVKVVAEADVTLARALYDDAAPWGWVESRCRRASAEDHR